MSKPRLMSEEIKRQLNQPVFKNVTPINRLSAPIADTPMVVKLDELRAYQYNPRKTRNPLYDDIKASIFARGLDQPPTITRRPHEDFYIIRNGGNTRLAILNELWQETGDKQFYNIPCLFKPWQNEASVLAGHLAENELRGELSFLERAQAVAHLKRLYEEADTPEGSDPIELSLRDLSERLKHDGYPLSFQRIGRMMECLRSLFPALPNALKGGLGNRKIEILLKLKSELDLIWKKYEPEQDFVAVWLNVLTGFDGDPANLPGRPGEGNIEDKMLGGMGDVLGVSFADLKMDLYFLRNPSKTHTEQVTEEDIVATAVQKTAEPLASVAPTPSGERQAHVPPASSVTNHTPSLPAAKPQNTEPLPVSAGSSVPVDASVPQPPAGGSEALSAQQRKALLDAHIVSPLKTNDRLRRIDARIAEVEGEQQPDFAETVTKAIPVVAGGGLCEVSDIWFITEDLDSPEALREQIGLLAQDIANWGQVSGLMPTDDGLGFSFQRLTHNGSAKAHTATLLLSSVIQRPEQTPNMPLPFERMAALFNQIMIGGFVHNEAAKDNIKLQRLPDTELVKWFRLIRLARHLMDLQSSM